MQEYRTNQQPQDFVVDEISGISLETSGEYLVFRMRKENYTTENACRQVAQSLGISRKCIGYAGSKDSRAQTSQNISIRSVSRGHVENLILKDISLEFLGHRTDPLSLGDLEGNKFDITIRNITESPRCISRMLNLFGKQRFSINNSAVGKAIVKREFKKAAELVCASSEYDKAMIENHLAKNENDYVGALKRIPWKNLQLYVHAFQSSMWNQAAEKYSENDRSTEATIPLLGFSTTFIDEEVRQLCNDILANEDVSLSDFVIRAIPDLTSDGGERKVYAEIKNLEIGELEEDNLNPGMKKCRVTFSLGKGSYATQAIKEMFSNTSS
jgi:tRNA pseudouridine13 synthase